MVNLLSYIVKNIVNNPDEVEVTSEKDGNTNILHVKVAEADYGKVIGKNGKVAQSIRAIIRSASPNGEKYIVKIGDKN